MGTPSDNTPTAPVRVDDLAVGYDGSVILDDLNFSVEPGEIFVVLGGSGCGKSTLLKTLIGLIPPLAGTATVLGENIAETAPTQRKELMRRFGVLYQGGALFGSFSVGENVALPLEEYTDLSKAEIAARVREKLRMVDLAGTEDKMPSELSGGMRKRAGLARAMALEPELLFFDEPSAGLDPITSETLDRLMLKLRDDLGTSMVVVTHELPSVFAIADRVVMVDCGRGQVALGKPDELRDAAKDEWVRRFLNRNDG